MIYLEPLIGGLLIGCAASLMLLFNGRVTGISGILGGLITGLQKPHKSDYWKFSFILGLIAGGFVLNIIVPEVFFNVTTTSNTQLVFAGLLVGFGTLLGTGCTSGHGVCGISRLSIRSLTATLLFIFIGALVAYIMKDLELR